LEAAGENIKAVGEPRSWCGNVEHGWNYWTCLVHSFFL